MLLDVEMAKGLCKVKKNSKNPKTNWKWVGWSRAHLDKKKLENRPKTKFCVCTIRPNMSLVVQQHQIKDWCWSTCCQPLSPAEEILYSW